MPDERVESRDDGVSLMSRERILVGTLGTLLGVSCSLLLMLGIGARAQPVAAPQEVTDNFAAHPAPQQPLPYSHKTHLALGLTCDTCHTNPGSGAQMGFPAPGSCMSCHAGVAADRPAIMQLAEYSASGESIPWARVYQVLTGVTWSHRPHLDAGIQCGACHGDVAKLDEMAMTTSVTAMASCISCHEAHMADTACATCHAWPMQ
jgi:hypothetical protein